MRIEPSTITTRAMLATSPPHSSSQVRVSVEAKATTIARPAKYTTSEYSSIFGALPRSQLRQRITTARPRATAADSSRRPSPSTIE